MSPDRVKPLYYNAVKTRLFSSEVGTNGLIVTALARKRRARACVRQMKLSLPLRHIYESDTHSTQHSRLTITSYKNPLAVTINY